MRRDRHAALRLNGGDRVAGAEAPVDRPVNPGRDHVKVGGGDLLSGKDDHRRAVEERAQARGEDVVVIRDRNRVERFFNRIKHCRRIATRYDKLGANFLAFLTLAAIRLWLRANESTS